MERFFNDYIENLKKFLNKVHSQISLENSIKLQSKLITKYLDSKETIRTELIPSLNNLSLRDYSDEKEIERLLKSLF